MPGTAKEQDGLATLNSKAAWLLDCYFKITKLASQQRFPNGLLTKVSKATDSPVEIVFRVHLPFSWWSFTSALGAALRWLSISIFHHPDKREISRNYKEEIVKYYLPSSSPGKPHVVALDKEVGALLGCILFSIIVIIMVIIRRRRRWRMPGGQTSPVLSSPTETNPSRCLCFAVADFMRSLTHFFQ